MAKEDDKPKTITVDLATLDELVNAKVRAGIAEATAKSTVEANDFENAMKMIRGQDKPAAPITYEECESPLTGARFRAKIMASRMSALGRVIDLEDYEWPPGVSIPQSAGGLMPDEFTAAIEAPEAVTSSAIKAKYDHWKYWEFRRVDQIEFASGKPFTTYIRRAEAEKRRAADAEAARQAALAVQSGAAV